MRKMLAMLLALAMVAAACGGGTTEEEPTETTAAPTSEEETTTTTEAMEEEPMEEDPLAGTTVTLSGPETGIEGDNFQAALDIFAAESGIDIQYAGSRDFSDVINAQAEAGNAPDIGIIPQPGKTLDFAANGWIVPIKDDTVATLKDTYDAYWTDLVTLNGSVYGVPNKGDVKSLVWYKPSVFAANGYEIPQTFDALLALADQMKADGITPWCVGIESGGATGWPFTDWMEDMMLRLHGPDVYDQWVNHEIPFNDPRVAQVAEAVLGVWEGDNVYASGGTIASTFFGDNGEPLVNEDCGMHRQANFFANFFPEGTTLGEDGDVNVFYFPTVSDEFGTTVLGAGTHAVQFRDAPEVDAVIGYLASPEFAEARGELGGFLSPNKAHDTDVYPTALERTLAGILVSADPFRFDASDLMPAAVGAGSFWTEGTAMVTGDKTVQEALDAIEASWPS